MDAEPNDDVERAMSRVELGWSLLIVIGLAAGAIIAFRVILYRERRRRAHWSTRTRAARPHWSIILADRIGQAVQRFSSRRRRFRRPRKREL